MRPLLTFVSGLAAGIVGIRLLKTVTVPENLRAATATRLDTLGDKARQGFDKAETSLRQATVSGLETIEKSSANLRGKLTPATPEVLTETPSAPQTEATALAAAEPSKDIKAKRRTPRKKSPITVAPATGADS